MRENFLLADELAEKLYHTYAEKLPIIDYHNHLSVSDIKNNRIFSNITELWLDPDPYKHRAMRMCGVNEKYITGNASPREKFSEFCRIFPRLIGTPVYQWSLLELYRVFGLNILPSEETADKIWNLTSEKLAHPELNAGGILRFFGAEFVSPCASLTDDFSLFLPESGVVPSLRGDNITSVRHEFIKALSKSSGVSVFDEESLKSAITVLLERFNSVGCRFSDHAIDNGFKYYPDDGKNDKRISAIISGAELTCDELDMISCHILRFLGSEYARLGWTMQLHIGAERYTSTRLRHLAGGAGGFAGIGHGVDVRSLASMLDDIDLCEYRLPKTVLFTLNPSDNAVMSVLSGSYSRDGVSGLIVQGPAWWWCDHLTGIREVLDSVSAYGVLSNFIGMTTDSRSFLSFVRHEYFRRILCSYISEKVHKGEFPDDEKVLGNLIENICYKNAAERISGRA